MSFKVIGVDHVQTAVPSPLEGECLAFYREVLGLREISKPIELRSRGGAWFQIGALQLHIGVDPGPSPESRRHVCLLVTDLSAAKAEIVARGVSIEEESEAEGLARFFIRDPAGNRLEIGQRK
jgi:catechol 2,3-dioxygenase-like lactoylglutathione lyase family enzyme